MILKGSFIKYVRGRCKVFGPLVNVSPMSPKLVRTQPLTYSRKPRNYNSTMNKVLCKSPFKVYEKKIP